MQNFKNSFVCKSLIDTGPFCGCWEAMDRETGDLHYLKIIEKSLLETPKITDNFSLEINLFGSLDFPTIPKLISFFSDESNFYVVFEKPEKKSLLEHIEKNSKIEDISYIRNFSVSFMDTIQYLLSNIDSTVQWSISTETIFINDDGSISQIFVIIKNSHLITLNNEISMKTTAPEIITHNKISQKCMSWILGCELFFISNGVFPFEGNTIDEIKHNILYSHPNFLSQLSKDCFDFINALLIKNPQMRMSIEKAATMSFINQTKDYSNNAKSFVKSLSADRILSRKSISSSILFSDSFYTSNFPEDKKVLNISSEAEIENEIDISNNSDNSNLTDFKSERKERKRKKRKYENKHSILDESSENEKKMNFSFSADIPVLSENEKKPELHRNSSFYMLPTDNKIHSLVDDKYHVKFQNDDLYNSKSFSYFYDKMCRNKVPLTPRKFFSPLQLGPKNSVNNKKSDLL